MQTFLPYEDFTKCAQVLDRQRLGKQRVECLQIAKALTDPDYGWQSHPAVTMWRGHLPAMLTYGVAICDEWIGRGYKDTCRDKLLAFTTPDEIMPTWMGDDDLHRSHRSNLLRKAPDHYAPLFEADLSDDLDYVWPK